MLKIYARYTTRYKMIYDATRMQPFPKNSKILLHICMRTQNIFVPFFGESIQSHLWPKLEFFGKYNSNVERSDMSQDVLGNVWDVNNVRDIF